ncbi:wax ester/triacylglycerol synthase domain-containing protein [Sorangium sp. So ce394]|uniref:wax ester/triacylglycerol synthase domain-containing protein n=1 Tax=Sorangium sp. So ce394 TaxID=3133310 RepID=UPI003F5C507F
MTSTVLLGGIDHFHLMNDRAMRARGQAGNHCLFVLELDGRLDLGRLAARLERATRALPELRFRLDNSVLGRVGRPRWVVDHHRRAPEPRLHEVAGERERAARVEALLAERISGERPWALDVVRGAGEGDTVVLRHHHALTDGRGADRLVAWLGSGSGDAPDDPPLRQERHDAPERLLAAMGRDERLALARAYKAHVLALGRAPILSLARACPGVRAATSRVARLALSAEETRAFDLRVRQRARLAETSLMLIAAARLADRALVARGFAPPHHVVPLPLSLDPKGGARRLFGNHLTMVLLSLGRDELYDDARAVARVAEQQRAMVRDRLDLAMVAALDLARWLPGPVYRWLGDQPFEGELASLIVSNPGAVTVDRFAGLPVRSAYPLPAVVTPPGFQVIFSRFGGRLSASIVYGDGLLRPDEAAAMPGALRAELLGEPAPPAGGGV